MRAAHLGESTQVLLAAKERCVCVNQTPEWFQNTLDQLLRNPSGFSGFSCTFISAFAAPQAFAPAQNGPAGAVSLHLCLHWVQELLCLEP